MVTIAHILDSPSFDVYSIASAVVWKEDTYTATNQKCILDTIFQDKNGAQETKIWR